LATHTTAQAQQLQLGLGRLRRASHHFQGQLLALEPQRLPSYSERHLRLRRLEPVAKPANTLQTSFSLDA
jgi:hypothetical protein